MEQKITADVDAVVTRTVGRLGAAPTDMGATISRSGARVRSPKQPVTDRFGLAFGAELGRGGMGTVRLARQESLERAVAVKSVLDLTRGEDVALLLRESNVLGRLEHPSVVPVHGLGWDEREGPLLVMKRIEGVSWRSQIPKTGGLDRLEHHLGILATVCQALHFAHARGVIHRDVKPENVMIGAYGEVYLVDWGIAHLPEDPVEPEPPLLGTPSFMAPEMVVGAPVDARTDVFLLGATLHQILTGASRHPGKDMSEVLRNAVLSQPHAYAPDVPPPLAALCNLACSVRPDARPPDALAFREALLGYQRHRASTAVATQARRSLAAADTAIAQGDPWIPLVVAARFGFEQAVREWPENTDAAAGIQTCVRRLLIHDLDSGNVRGAELLLSELKPPDEALTRRFEALQASLRQGALLATHLAALRRDLQLEGTTWARSIGTLVTGTLSGLYIYAGGILARRSGGEPSLEAIIEFFGVGLVATLVGLFVLRRQLLDNALYRKLMTAFALTIPFLAIAATLGVQSGATFHQLVVGGIAMMGAFALLLANVVSPVFVIAFVDAIAAGFAATTWPEAAVEFAALAWIAHTLWLGWVLRPAKRSTP